MGSGEMGTPTKTTKTSTSQEQTPPPAAATAAVPYPDWAAAAFQAYYSSAMSPLPHPGYYPSTMGSGPQPHPYMWGAQPLVPPPFGTPPPYAAMYPPSGMYGHPPMTPVATSVGTDPEGKSDEKKKSSKKSKGTLGSLVMLTGKTSDMSKANANGAVSNSGDSASEGSTEGSEGMSGDGSQELCKNTFDQGTSEAPNSQMVNSSPFGNSQDVNHPMGNHASAAIPISIAGKQVVGAGPVTNLNIGMDYWSGGTPSLLAGNRGAKRSSMAGNSSALIPASANSVSGEIWMQDERELKRQRRKQSNRESARRSRLRKQAECEELATKVQSLTAENASLREELNRMTEECKKLSAENSSLQDQLHMPRSESELPKIGSNISKPDLLRDGLQLDHDSL